MKNIYLYHSHGFRENNRMPLVMIHEFQESPSSKLLFAKDIERYRPSVALFFRKVQKAKEISSQQFFANISFLAQVNFLNLIY